MSIFIEFVKGLFSSFKKNEILESAELTKTGLERYTLPQLVSAKELWAGQKFKNKDVQKLVAEFSREVNSKPVFETLLKAGQNGLTVIELASKYSEKIFSETEANQGLTYSKAAVVRVIQATEYFSTYSRRFMNFVFSCEATELNEGDIAGKLSPAEVKWVYDGMPDFIIAVKVMLTDVKALEDYIKGLPDAIVNELSEKAFATTIGMSKLDPMGMRGFSVRVNPFYIRACLKAESQAADYKAKQEEARLLQMRLLHLRKLLDRSPDAKLQAEIDYTQDRVTGLIQKLTEMEREYGLGT